MLAVLPYCRGGSRGALVARSSASLNPQLWQARESSSDAKRLAAAALILHVRVVEFETLVESLAREVELGAVEIRKTARLDDDSDTVTLEAVIFRFHLVGVLELVRETRTASRTHAQAHAHTLPALG